ncbi:hypothetical protein OIU84_023705 [Salix udensis]|uniref:Uncharacterized protein n=1 Tax=Salix udensis TaxID=889485 RepID=A0AAD6KRD7_9ROSI|nr:hypothetical protein OIU84_023705 [Salix udensis]
MKRRGRDCRFGVVSMCIGTGMGAAAVFEKASSSTFWSSFINHNISVIRSTSSIITVIAISLPYQTRP